MPPSYEILILRDESIVGRRSCVRRERFDWSRKILGMAHLQIREAQRGDEDDLAAMMALLWPEGRVDEHRREAEELIRTRMYGTMPGVFLLAVEENQKTIGFVQVGLRSHADGCDMEHPVAFIEGWFVHESFRGAGIGRKLMEAAENWGRTMRCHEIASDALIANDESIRAHTALGFESVDRCIHFRKKL
jgi:aminoglycoside 6'-N-acetyltransferase I